MDFGNPSTENYPVSGDSRARKLVGCQKEYKVAKKIEIKIKHRFQRREIREFNSYDANGDEKRNFHTSEALIIQYSLR